MAGLAIGRRRAGGRPLEVGRHDLRRRLGRGRVGVAGDQGAAGGQCAGIRRRLHVPALGDLAPDVDGEGGEGEEDRDQDGEEHEDLPALIGPSADQLITMVAVACWTNRPPASVERMSPMNGTMMFER